MKEHLDKAKEVAMDFIAKWFPNELQYEEIIITDLKDLIIRERTEAEEKGILKGFKMSAEGFNGEYPFKGKSDEYILKGFKITLKKLQAVKK